MWHIRPRMCFGAPPLAVGFDWVPHPQGWVCSWPGGPDGGFKLHMKTLLAPDGANGHVATCPYSEMLRDYCRSGLLRARPRNPTRCNHLLNIRIQSLGIDFLRQVVHNGPQIVGILSD
jgi:hypothetical protein